jgi:uncharacterized protein (DUF433 family)
LLPRFALGAFGKWGEMMETNVTPEQVVQELEQVRRKLREVKEQYVHSMIENGVNAVPNTEPSRVLTSNGERIEYPTEQPHIYTNPEMHVGEPTIRGSGIMVRTIIERLRIGQHPLEIYKAFPHLNLAKI